MTVLLLPFLYEFLLFFWSSFIHLAETSGTVLNWNSGSRHPCLVPEIKVKTFIIKSNVTYTFFINALYQVEEVLSYFQFIEKFFIRKGCWILLNPFLYLLTYASPPPFSSYLMWWIIFIDFQIISWSYIPGIKLTYYKVDQLFYLLVTTGL